MEKIVKFFETLEDVEDSTRDLKKEINTALHQLNTKKVVLYKELETIRKAIEAKEEQIISFTSINEGVMRD